MARQSEQIADLLVGFSGRDVSPTISVSERPRALVRRRQTGSLQGGANALEQCVRLHGVAAAGRHKELFGRTGHLDSNLVIGAQDVQGEAVDRHTSGQTGSVLFDDDARPIAFRLEILHTKQA